MDSTKPREGATTIITDGCNATLTNQTFLNQVALENVVDALSLENKTTAASTSSGTSNSVQERRLVAHFEVSISCAACSFDEAFAPYYPPSLQHTGARKLLVDGTVTLDDLRLASASSKSSA